MDAEENNNNDNNYGDYFLCFVSATGRNLIGKLLLPEAKGKLCFETLGWFVTLSETRDMSLLHPLTRVQIPLPHISTFKNYPGSNEFVFIQKTVLSSRPSVSVESYALMVIYGCYGLLGFWKPGEKAWTTVETRQSTLMDITYWNGQFYVVSIAGKIHVCDVGGRDPTVALVIGKIPNVSLPGKRPYVVELENELLVVVRDLYQYNCSGHISGISYRTRSFVAFKLDSCSGSWKELKSLGDNALILGYNASISVPTSKFKGVRRNCIYYSEDILDGYLCFKQGRVRDIGIYNMEDQSQVPCCNEEAFMCPPIWVIPHF